MKQIKVAEATPKQLNWLVAKIEGKEPTLRRINAAAPFIYAIGLNDSTDAFYSQSWHQGGPIIENHIFRLEDDPELGWLAESGTANARGNTALIAAMRCYVISQLGDLAEVPEELA